MLHTIALAAALTFCPNIPAQKGLITAGGPRMVADLLPLATEALVFNPEHNLEQLVAEYARVTGQSASVGAETMSMLSSTKVSISPTTSVPPALAQQMFEQVLVDSGFVLSVLSDVQPRVFSVRSIRSSSRVSLRDKARYVAREDLEVYGSHPAIMIRTVVSLPNTDVRQLSNAMRSLITDANIQQLLPAGASNSMVLVGLGTPSVELVHMLERIDAGYAADLAANPELFEIMPLKHALAAGCIPLLTHLLGTKGRESMVLPKGLRVIADPRTNSLLIHAYAGQMADVRRVLALLDRKQ